jgi:hypothetical protein
MMMTKGSRGLLLPSAAVTRRRFCETLVSGAAIIGPALSPLNALAAPTLDLDHDPDLLQAMIKMRGSLDSELVIGWLRAKRFAVSQGRIEPLCGVLAATFKRFRQVSEELFEMVALEIVHYTDFETGELLDRLVMPFVDKEVEVPLYRFGPARSRFAVQLDEKEEFSPSSDTNENEFAPAGSVLMTKSIRAEAIRGGNLFMRHEEHGRVRPRDSEIPTMFYKESTLWSAGLADVLDTSTRNVDASVGYSAMTSWRPWMQMADLPGHTTSNGFGGKAKSLADLPEDFLRYTRQQHPDVLEDPQAVLDAFHE